MGVTRGFAAQQVADFNAYYDNQPPYIQHHFTGPATMGHYETCFICGNDYTLFRDALPGDCPTGCTISPIIDAEREHG